MDVEQVERLASMSNDGFLRGPTLQLCAEYRHLIEQHDAKMREVSDAVKMAMDQTPDGDTSRVWGNLLRDHLSRFILPEPVDPLVEAINAVDRELHLEGFTVIHPAVVKLAALRVLLTKEPNQ